MAKILFLHGWQSVPGGVKPTLLAQHGHEVINPNLPDEDFALPVMLCPRWLTTPIGEPEGKRRVFVERDHLAFFLERIIAIFSLRVIALIAASRFKAEL